MKQNNNYQNIEDQIRQELEKVRNLTVGLSCSEDVTSGDSRKDRLRKGLTNLGISLSLAKTKSLLQKLPKTYHSLTELNDLYWKLI